jgi:hypothetical protein
MWAPSGDWPGLLSLHGAIWVAERENAGLTLPLNRRPG